MTVILAEKAPQILFDKDSRTLHTKMIRYSTAF